MGFIEELRRRTEETKTRNRELEEATRSRLESAKRQSEQEKLDKLRREDLRIKGLEDSIVPQLASDLVSAGAGTVEDFDRSSTGWPHPAGFLSLRFEEGNRIRQFNIQAYEDGSIQIGNRVLSSTDATNPQTVEKAMEKAYKSAKVITESVSHNDNLSNYGGADNL